MACGAIDVYAAAQTISDAIPDILSHAEDTDSSWFDLGWSSLSSFIPIINRYTQGILPIHRKSISRLLILLIHLSRNIGRCILC